MKNSKAEKARVTANENPLKPELLGYCFDKILRFDIKYRLFEKINYVVIFKYKGTYAVAVDRKMDYYVEIESQFKNEFMVLLTETKEALQKLFKILTVSAYKQNKITLINQMEQFRNKLSYYEDEAEKFYQIQKKLEKEESSLTSFIENPKKAFLICEEMGWEPNDNWRYFIYAVENYIDVFFSYIEHLLTLLIPFSSKIDLEKSYKDMWEYSWSAKAEFLWGKEIEGKKIIEQLRSYKEIFRNRNAHGLFSRETSAYVQIEGLGRYPMYIGKKYLEGFLDENEAFITYDTFQEFKSLGRNFMKFVYDKEPFAMIFIDSNLPIPVEVEILTKGTKSEEEAQQIIEQEYFLQDIIQNMDW